MKEFRESLVVGKKDVHLAAPSHVPGVHEGNWPVRARRGAARRRGGRDGDVTRTRSTGINADERAPILPDMPRLSPP
jgi:hypothetical protein